MGQAESCAAALPNTFQARQRNTQRKFSRIHELKRSGPAVPPKSPSSTGTSVTQDDLKEAAADFLKELIIDSSALMVKKLHPLLLELLDSSRCLDTELSLLQSSSSEEQNLPELKGNHFQVGERYLENFTLYVRIGPWEAVKKCFHSGENPERYLVSVCLKVNEKDFSNRDYPAEVLDTLDLKLSMRSNPKDFYEFLGSFSLQVQISMESHPSEAVCADVKVQRSLLDTMATSFLLPVKAGPASTHYVDCSVFLERPSDNTCDPSDAVKPRKSLCSGCSQNNSLLRVFREVKSSVKIIDLASAPIDAAPIKNPSVQAGKPSNNHHPPENLKNPIAEPCLTLAALPHSQNDEEVNDGPRPRQNLEKASETARPPTERAPAKGSKPPHRMIKRKHARFPHHKLLMMKLAQMQERLKQLEEDLVEKEPQTEATTLILTPAAKKCYDTRKFTCPQPGCGEKFNNKSTLSRHRKRIHFPNKLPKCHNCEHVFPRPYMLKRHLDRMVCMSSKVKNLHAHRIKSARTA